MIAPVLLITAAGLVGGVLLIAVYNLLGKRDDRTERVYQALPAVDCKGCGYANCGSYAEAIIEQDVSIGLCVPGGNEVAQEIAQIMQVEPIEVPAAKAYVACQGSYDKCEPKYRYSGVQTCMANARLEGGNATCPYACLGFGDCISVCKFDAITVDNGVAKIDEEKCTGCGMCAKVCPKNVIWVREQSQKPVVLCENRQRGALARDACTVGCISCMRCVKVCPSKAMKVQDNIARIDLDLCTACGECVPVCPVKCIIIPGEAITE